MKYEIPKLEKPQNGRRIAIGDINGCADTLNFTVEEISPPNDLIEIDPLFEIFALDTVNLNPVFNGIIDTAFWTGDIASLVCSDCLNNSAFPNQTTQYTINIIDQDGCMYSEIVTVRVKSDLNYYAPNIFTPNNDGINDLFTIYSTPQLSSINLFEVYNRWGELVFREIDVDSQNLSRGWVGTFKDRKVNSGVFSWVAKLEYINGEVQLVSGSITVMN